MPRAKVRTGATGPSGRPQRITCLAAFLPGIALLRAYRAEWFSGDLLAGISVCVIMIPSVTLLMRRTGWVCRHNMAYVRRPRADGRLRFSGKLAAGDCRPRTSLFHF